MSLTVEAIRVTENVRATFVPVGVILASLFALIGIVLTLRSNTRLQNDRLSNERRISRETWLLQKRAETYVAAGEKMREVVRMLQSHDKVKALASFELFSTQVLPLNVYGSSEMNNIVNKVIQLYHQVGTTQVYYNDVFISAVNRLTAQMIVIMHDEINAGELSKSLTALIANDPIPTPEPVRRRPQPRKSQ